MKTRILADRDLKCAVRAGDTYPIDRTSDVWIARLEDHKSVHHGKIGVLVSGPNSQLILKKYLRGDPSAKLFPIKREPVFDAPR